jgi:hypothetical protein
MNDSSLPTPAEMAHPVPMTFGQIFDRTFKLGRANFKRFAGIASVPSAAFLVMMAAFFGCMIPIMARQAAHPDSPPQMLPNYFFAVCMVFAYPVMFAVAALYLPAASFAAIQADQGVKVTVRHAYQVALRHFWRYLWLIILPALYVFVPLVAIGALAGTGALWMNHAGLASNSAAPFFLIPLAILLYLGVMVYMVLIMLRFALAFPASVEEGLTARASLRRSALLTYGAKGRIFLMILLVGAIGYAVNLVLMLIFFVVAAICGVVAAVAHVTEGSTAFIILIGLAGLGYLVTMFGCMLFSYVGYTTALAVLYRDQRLRIDGPQPAAPLPATPPAGELA